MKKISILLFGMAAVAFYGCQAEREFEENVPAKHHTVMVTVKDVPDPKTSMVENGSEVSYIWSEGDEADFHIFENGVEASSVSMASLSEDRRTATFSATFAGSEAAEYAYSAVYARHFINGSATVPSLQHPASDSFDPSADILVSAEDILSSGQPAASLQFSLVRMVSVNKMTLKGLMAGEKVKTVILSSDNAIFANGSGTISFDFRNDASAVVGADGTFPVYMVSAPVSNASFRIYAETDQAVYERDNFSSKLNFDYGTVHRFGLQLGEYRFAGGSKQHPWRLATPADVQEMRSRLNPNATVYFEVVADIDLSGVDGWVPLNSDKPYALSIDLNGNGHTFSGFHCSGGEYPSFAGVLNGTVKDLTFDRATISGEDTKSGVLAGYLGTGTIQASVSGVTITGSSVSNQDYAGGLAGQVGNIASVTDCHVRNTSVSSTSERIGGLIGQLPEGFSITGCSAENVTVSGIKNIGGLIGVAYGSVTGCHSSGTVSSTNTASNYDIAIGGLVGYFEKGTISDCHSSVTINQTTNGRDIGGLVGKMLAGRIEKSYATGNVSGIQRNVGGFVGLVTLTSGTSVITDCYATGNVTANAYNGGFLGLYEKGSCSISNCYASGNVSATGGFAAGGLIGVAGAADITVQHCAAWNGSVTPKNYGSANWSSAAVVGVTFPTCTLTDNYRNPDMALTAYWVPAAGYQHANVSASHPLVKQDGTESTATSTSNGQDGYPQFPYHGKVEAGKTLSQLASTTLGWSSSIWDFSDSMPSIIAGSYSGSGTSGEEEEHEWDANRGRIVTPGSEWTSTVIADGLTYYKYERFDDLSGARQDVYAVDLDLSKPGYKVHFSYTDGGAITSDIQAANSAWATCNGTFELGSVFTKINGYKWSVIRNDYIGDGSNVPNWKSEGAMFIDNAGNIRIGFDGKGKSLDELRSFYRTSTWPNIFSGAPMLIDDFEPVGESFVNASLTAEQLELLDYENPDRHQGVRHPRTAVALTENGHFLMIVADGRYRDYGAGMTAAELTRFLVRHFNPRYALNFDGGGSSTLCVRGQGDAATNVVNYPCDNRGSYGLVHDHGGERSVSTHIWIGAE